MPIMPYEKLIGYQAEVELTEAPDREKPDQMVKGKLLRLLPVRFGPTDKVIEFGMTWDYAVDLGHVLTGESEGKIDIVSDMPSPGQAAMIRGDGLRRPPTRG